MFKFLEKLEDYSRIPLRLGLGVLFLYAGIIKAMQFSAYVSNFQAWGLSWPAPALWLGLVMVAEIIGGILVIIGLLTRIAGAWLSVTQLVALIVLAINGAETFTILQSFAHFSAALLLVFGGPGKWSLDYKLLLE